MLHWFQQHLRSSYLGKVSVVTPSCALQSAREGKTILRLNKSIYGLSAAPKLWYKHIVKALKEDRFIEKNLILFCSSKRSWYLLCTLTALGKQDVDERMVEKLRKKGFKLTRERSFSEFLGIRFEKNPVDQSIIMTLKKASQTGLKHWLLLLAVTLMVSLWMKLGTILTRLLECFCT